MHKKYKCVKIYMKKILPSSKKILIFLAFVRVFLGWLRGQFLQNFVQCVTFCSVVICARWSAGRRGKMTTNYHSMRAVRYGGVAAAQKWIDKQGDRRPDDLLLSKISFFCATSFCLVKINQRLKNKPKIVKLQQKRTPRCDNATFFYLFACGDQSK